MSDVVEETPCGFVLDDHDGHRRVVLTECPMCGMRVSHPEVDTGARATVSLSEHIFDVHPPEDIGLTPMLERDAKLSEFGGASA